MFDRIALLMGMPRSGTSWLSQIIDSCPMVRFRLSPLFSYEFKDQLDEQSTRNDWQSLLEATYDSSNDFMNQTYRRESGEFPTFTRKESLPPVLLIKDTRYHHLTERVLEMFDMAKLVAIVRHPCGAIHSWLTAPGEFPRDADPMSQWRCGSVRKTGIGEFWGFEDWKLVTAQHMRLEARYPSRVMIVRYEDLVSDRFAEVRRIFSFLEIPYGAETEQFLKASGESHMSSEYAVFKKPSVRDRWRSELQAEIREPILEELRGTEFERFLL